MRRIYKYKVPVTDNFTLELPKGAEILKFDSQRDQPTIWALVDPDAELETRRFVLVGTGHPIKETRRLKFLGTCQIMGGDLIWHLFEVIPGPV